MSRVRYLSWIHLERRSRTICRFRGFVLKGFPMKLALSTIREKTPFATPPRIIVVAEEGYTGEAIHLADILEEMGAETEVRFGDDADFTHGPFHPAPDAVIVAGKRGYRVARHHPILDNVLPIVATPSRW
jgi:hypothetical protein